MTVGGSTQVGLTSTQDLYLTGNPQITYFKAVYRRHTNFAIEAIPQSFNGTVSATSDNNLTCIISKSADLIKDIWVEVDLSDTAGASLNANNAFTGGTYASWCNNTGHAFLKRSQMYIGSDYIDQHDSMWLDIWNELTDHDEKEHLGLNKSNSKNTHLKAQNNAGLLPTCTLNIPLKFWFNRNPGLAIPINALTFSDVKLVLQTRDLRALVNTDATGVTPNGGGAGAAGPILFGSWNSSKIQIYVDYIFLDGAERTRFTNKAHEYLIEQVQYDNPLLPNTISGVRNFRMRFSHPVKELIWVFFTSVRNTQRTNLGAIGQTSMDTTLNTNLTTTAQTTGIANAGQGNDYFNYGLGFPIGQGGPVTNYTPLANPLSGADIYMSTVPEHFDTLELLLDNNRRFAPRKATYFRTCQPLQAGHKIPNKHIYVYSFALNPEDYQPSGTCNFSRIDSVDFKFNDLGTIAAGAGATSFRRFAVYAVNYNILRIMSGMGGLAYTN